MLPGEGLRVSEGPSDIGGLGGGAGTEALRHATTTVGQKARSVLGPGAWEAAGGAVGTEQGRVQGRV